MERDITTFENASKALCQSERTRLIARAAPRLAQDEEPGRTGRDTRSGRGLSEMTRRKREITGLANEQDFPYLVELALPPEGFRSVLLEIDAFHAAEVRSSQFARRR